MKCKNCGHEIVIREFGDGEYYHPCLFCSARNANHKECDADIPNSNLPCSCKNPEPLVRGGQTK